MRGRRLTGSLAAVHELLEIQVSLSGPNVSGLGHPPYKLFSISQSALILV